jgi:hypothetical protein
MINTYLAGSLVRVATYAGSPSAPVGGFRDASGAFIDPATVVLKYKPGASAALVTVTFPAAPMVKDGPFAGLYHADLDTTGFLTTTWVYTWTGTGTGQAIASGTFNVLAAPF